jgi:hypothetical protein
MDNENTTQASYWVSQCTVLAGEAHTIAEISIIPCAAKMIKHVGDKHMREELKKIQLLNTTVHSCIHCLSADTEHELVT